MTREELKHRIQIAQAWMDGKVAQCKTPSSPTWLDVPMVSQVSHEYAPRFFFDTDVEWRVKPEPREFGFCLKCRRCYLWIGEGQLCCGNSPAIHVREVI
jgi:hypothetical protein